MTDTTIIDQPSEGVAPAVLDEAARGRGDRAKAEAQNLAGEVKERATSFAEQQKNRGAERLDSLAAAAQRAADSMESEAPEAARYIRRAADGARDFSHRMRERSIDDVIADANEFARRQPLLVIGGAVLAGLALSRFLQSSGGRSTQRQTQGGSYRGGEYDDQ